MEYIDILIISKRMCVYLLTTEPIRLHSSVSVVPNCAASVRLVHPRYRHILS